ncbi:hypothetical protein GCM10027048_20770 [Hymenobacter coalescens]
MKIEIPDQFLDELKETIVRTVRHAMAQVKDDAVADGTTADKPLRSKQQVCEELGISKTTLTEWMKSGVIPFIRLGRRIYFEKNQVLEAGRRHTKYQRRS